jgi:hypothetical protein
MLFVLLLGGLGAASLVWLRSYQASLEREEALRLSQQGHFPEAEAGLLRAYARNATDVDSVRALSLGYTTAARDPEAAVYLRAGANSSPTYQSLIGSGWNGWSGMRALPKRLPRGSACWSWILPMPNCRSA